LKENVIWKKSGENSFFVCIFGSARIKKDDPEYDLIYQLSSLIAEEGMNVVTGGGPSLMEAASKGHKEGRKDRSVQTVGLTINLPKKEEANPHLDIKKEFEKFSSRLDNFMVLSNVVVVAPGGVGTLLEFLYTWQLVPEFLDWVEKWPLKKQLISPEDMFPLFLAEDIQGAMKVIRTAHEEYKMGKEDFCLSHDKYWIE
jgi:uncharacterized protein (TIGR00725 family)